MKKAFFPPEAEQIALNAEDDIMLNFFSVFSPDRRIKILIRDTTNEDYHQWKGDYNN